MINYSIVSFLKVNAFDADSQKNGEVKYNPLKGNDVVLKSFHIDQTTGDLFLIDNQLIDREKIDSKFDIKFYYVLEQRKLIVSSI